MPRGVCTGPSTGCTALGQIPKGKKVYLWDTHGHHWQYVRIADTNKRGWVATKYIGA
ncbi:SH3 domain-containing protein [Streptomyces sp. NPDC054757]